MARKTRKRALGATPRELRSGRGRLFACLTMLGLIASGWAGCVVRRPGDTCKRQSDCSAGRFCTGRGFCENECLSAKDCPCGSFCAIGCGICVRNDLRGPSTCVAYDRGLSTNEVLGACRADIEAREEANREADSSADPDAGDAGVCAAPPEMPQCISSPPLDAANEESSTDGASEPDARDDDNDAANEASITDARSSDTGGEQ